MNTHKDKKPFCYWQDDKINPYTYLQLEIQVISKKEFLRNKTCLNILTLLVRLTGVLFRKVEPI